MKKIAIIGGGFTGTMTAVQIIENAQQSCEIILINERETLTRGIAYNPYSEKHLLNVVAAKMSAYPDRPSDFLDWVMQQHGFKNNDRALIANSYLPRKIYGDYICAIWEAAKKMAEAKNITVTVLERVVLELDIADDAIFLLLNNETQVSVDQCVIASGNQMPRNPKIGNMDFYSSKRYFQNPWKIESVKDNSDDLPVLIIGNGLTMVDTVLGLLEQGYKGKMYSISPNGFNILPHRHSGLVYTKLTEELKEGMSLFEFLKLVNKHIKMVREFGISAEPIIDSLRPHTQRIWKALSHKEKQLFMGRLRHLWGVARHRIPLHTHDKIQQLRIDGKLQINSGKLLDIIDSKDVVTVKYLDKKENKIKNLNVSKVINCTGPDTDFSKLDNSFLKTCMMKGILMQDFLKLGIKADTETFQIIDSDGKRHINLFTIGSSLKGELWESTAVNELRTQAKRLAESLTT